MRRVGVAVATAAVLAVLVVAAIGGLVVAVRVAGTGWSAPFGLAVFVAAFALDRWIVIRSAASGRPTLYRRRRWWDTGRS